jgi:tellurite resistance protein
MTTLDELRPLFTEVTMSRDEANAIVAALRDVAESDGMHDEELAMIQGFVETLDADLGELEPTIRTVAVQCAVLLALADGAISDKERERVVAYAGALGMGDDQYRKIETILSDWMSSGDLDPLMA